ncbi:hypothetical protein Tco_1221191 [Tanacetum coccineum]
MQRFNPIREIVTKHAIKRVHTQNLIGDLYMPRFSPNKTSDVYEKTSPRSDLRWKPTGRIFKTVGLRWIPTGNLFDSCTSKVNSEPPHGSNVDIPNIHECKQTLDVSAGTSINFQKEQSLDLSAEHAEFDESNANVLERFYTLAGNPVKEILLKLNLPDQRILKDRGEGT